MDENDLEKMYGLKSVISCHLIQILFLHLVVKAHQREDQMSILVMCLFDIFEKIFESQKGKDLIFDV